MDSIQNFFNHSPFLSTVYSKGEDLIVQIFNKGIPFAPPVPSSSVPFGYWTMVRHLKEEDLSILEEKIRLLGPNQPTKEAILLEALEKQDWSSSIFQEDYLIYALAALKEGKLKKEQFATLTFYWTAATYNTPSRTAKEIRSIPLFTPEGNPNKEAWDRIRQTAVRDLTTPADEPAPPIGEEKMQELFHRMKNSPVSEQQIFVYEKGLEGDSEMARVLKVGGFYLLTVGKEPMIPSMTLMQESLSILYEQQAVEIDPILGLAPFKHIASNAAGDQRTMSLHFPHISPLPQRADDLYAPGIDFIFHDFYHSWIFSVMPPAHRYAFARAANLLDYQGERSVMQKEYVVKLKDLETLSYRENKKVDQALADLKIPFSERFWFDLILFNFMRMKGEECHFAFVLMDYFQHQDEWKRDFHIEVTSDTKGRIAELITRMLTPQAGNKIKQVWTRIELAWEAQQLILAGNLLEAQEKIKLVFSLHESEEALVYSEKTGRNKIEDPQCLYFFPTFNDKTAFVQMLQLLPENVLPLTLSGCHMLDDELLEKVVAHVNKQRKSPLFIWGDEKINLNGCSSLTSQSLKLLAQSGYRQFDLSGCDSLVDELSLLPPDTTELTLNYLRKLKDDHLKNLKHCHALASLSLSGNASLTDAGLNALLDLPNLKYLRLDGCNKITCQGIKTMIRTVIEFDIGEIEAIHVNGCKNLNLNPDELKKIAEEAAQGGIFIDHDKPRS